MAPQSVRCPKCGDRMQTRNRNGVRIEQCLRCHGIFLDRGELERLIGIESNELGSPTAPSLR
jgi:uncharacterized protein